MNKSPGINTGKSLITAVVLEYKPTNHVTLLSTEAGVSLGHKLFFGGVIFLKDFSWKIFF